MWHFDGVHTVCFILAMTCVSWRHRGLLSWWNESHLSTSGTHTLLDTMVHEPKLFSHLAPFDHVGPCAIVWCTSHTIDNQWCTFRGNRSVCFTLATTCAQWRHHGLLSWWSESHLSAIGTHTLLDTVFHQPDLFLGWRHLIVLDPAPYFEPTP